MAARAAVAGIVLRARDGVDHAVSTSRAVAHSGLLRQLVADGSDDTLLGGAYGGSGRRSRPGRAG